MMINLTAAGLKAILCYIAPEGVPGIAYDNDKMAKPLFEKIKEAVCDRTGSEAVFISFDDSKKEKELLRQFNGVCKEIKETFSNIEFASASV